MAARLFDVLYWTGRAGVGFLLLVGGVIVFSGATTHDALLYGALVGGVTAAVWSVSRAARYVLVGHQRKV